MFLQNDDITWFIVKVILNEEGYGNTIIKKQHDKFHLKWVISIRQQMIIANLIDEHFCWKLFDITIVMCHSSRRNGAHIFHFGFRTTTTISKHQLH